MKYGMEMIDRDATADSNRNFTNYCIFNWPKIHMSSSSNQPLGRGGAGIFDFSIFALIAKLKKKIFCNISCLRSLKINHQTPTATHNRLVHIWIRMNLRESTKSHCLIWPWKAELIETPLPQGKFVRKHRNLWPCSSCSTISPVIFQRRLKNAPVPPISHVVYIVCVHTHWQVFHRSACTSNLFN